MKKSLHLLLLCGALVASPLAAIPVHAAPDDVKVLADIVAKNDSSGNEADISRNIGPFKNGALVFVTANGATEREVNSVFAGLLVTIERDGNNVAEDEAFDYYVGNDVNFTHKANAAFSFFLRQNKVVSITAIASPLGEGGVDNSDTEVSLRIHAIRACKVC